ncbi:magnesium transporter [Chromatiales bacterium (ex Bugula neritina AB1)]|nr:magnesium transporter [Chromatiales bacterium (ex Bugula neritina AB1)]
MLDSTKVTDEERQDAVAEILNSGSFNTARELIQALQPAEVADLLESLPTAKRKLLWTHIALEHEGEILLEVGDEVRNTLIEEMDTAELVAISENLDIDDLADYVQALPDQVTNDVLHSMDKQYRERLESVLSYPEDSAGGLMDLDLVTARADVSLDVVLRYLRLKGSMPRNTDRIIITDRYGIYQGVLPIRQLLTNDPETRVADVMRTDVDVINVSEIATDVARLFEDHDLISAPVVDNDNRLLGRITIDDVVDVIREDAEQVVMSMAGLSQEDDFFSPVVRSMRRRTVWLGINLATAFLASWVAGQFANTLDQIVTLAILMTIVPSMGGIAGSQTLTLVIRGQALGQIGAGNTRWMLVKEAIVGLLNGLVWSAIVALIAYLWFGDSRVGLVIGLALVINMSVAGIAGVMIPVLLKRLDIDPALAGGVVLTTVTDVVGLMAFLGLATALLM